MGDSAEIILNKQVISSFKSIVIREYFFRMQTA
jgi:hypothetical protein